MRTVDGQKVGNALEIDLISVADSRALKPGRRGGAGVWSITQRSRLLVGIQWITPANDRRLGQFSRSDFSVRAVPGMFRQVDCQILSDADDSPRQEIRIASEMQRASLRTVESASFGKTLRFGCNPPIHVRFCVR